MAFVLRRCGNLCAVRRRIEQCAVFVVITAAASGCGITSATTPRPATHTPRAAAPVVTPSTVVRAVPGATSTLTVPAPTTSTPSGLPLAGLTVGVDPGHNGMNYANPGVIDTQVWNGRNYEDCNTTGTETDSGFTEAQFNWNVSQYLEADLVGAGARVVLTRTSNDGIGPCVDVRSRILNTTNIAVAIHADGGPPTGRGFAVLEPVADGINSGAVASSMSFGTTIRDTFASVAGMPISTYDGTSGIALRSDLAGTNLTTVPYVLIECGNMRNATDAALLVTSTFQQRAALALTEAIEAYEMQGH